jgi:hypothetical protein
MFRTGRVGACVAALALVVASCAARAADDPLPSWNDGAARQAIVGFVEAVTTEGGADYVASADRIATFDNDSRAVVRMANSERRGGNDV